MALCPRCQPRDRARLLVRRNAEAHVGQKRPRPSEAAAEAEDGLPVHDAPPLAPLRGAIFDPIAAFGNTRTWSYFFFTLHCGGFSHDRARVAISHELSTTSPDPPLLLEARDGLRKGYAIVDDLAEQLGMNFIEHRVPIELCIGSEKITFEATLHLRSLMSCCKLLFGRVHGAQHCVPQSIYHEGSRVYSHPMTALWAERQFKELRRLDPEGVLFPIDVAWDKTSLSKVQTAFPMYVKADAWPLDEQNRHRGRVVWGYFDSLPDALQLKLSTAKATEARRLMAYTLQRLAFDEFREPRWLLAQTWEDAGGLECSVHVRIQNLIVDYIDYSMASGTRQNQVCPQCMCPTGSFHLPEMVWARRTGAESSAEVKAAWREEPNRAAVERRLQPQGLQLDDAPLRTVAPGLDPHSGVGYAKLHNDFEGVGKVTYEAMLRRVQQQAGAGWRPLMRRIDAWVTEAARFTKFTTFSHGLSHYFYVKPTNGPAGGRGGAAAAATTAVSFGKITSKQVYRDIFRFWRVLMIDVLPDDAQLLEAVGLYLEWLDRANAPAHVRLTLLDLSGVWADAINGFVSVFGAALYSRRIKVELHKHVPENVSSHGALRYHSDELHLETSHLRGAKEPWRHTNHKKPEAQMARYVTRRDMLELLNDRFQEQLAASSGGGVAAGGATPAAQVANQLMAAAQAAKRCYALNCTFRELERQEPQLRQLSFAARQFLYLGAGGDGDAAAAQFPQFDRDSVQLRPGAHLYERLDSHRVQVGGRELSANVLQEGRARVFVAIESDDDSGARVTYYAQLVLCFSGMYLGEQRQMCYVRWLHTASAVARERKRPLTQSELRGPFEAYRWAIYPQGRAGHPARGGPWYGVVSVRSLMYRVHMVHSMHDADLYRLNTDVWLEYL